MLPSNSFSIQYKYKHIFGTAQWPHISTTRDNNQERLNIPSNNWPETYPANDTLDFDTNNYART